MNLRAIKDEIVAAAREEMPPAEYFDTHQTAAYLSVTRKQLEHLRRAGGGPAYSKWGRLVRYRRTDLDAYMASLRVENTAQEVHRG